MKENIVKKKENCHFCNKLFANKRYQQCCWTSNQHTKLYIPAIINEKIYTFKYHSQQQQNL